MNNIHTLALGKRYRVWTYGNNYENRNIETSTFSIEFTCNVTDENYPYVTAANETKCVNYDWCGNNYRVDFYGTTCLEFNACIEKGDGDGSVNPSGIPCYLLLIWEQFEQA